MSTAMSKTAEPAAVTVKEAAEEATKLLTTAIERILGKGDPKAGADAPRILFPNGIELIYLAFKVGSDISISLAIAGKDAPVKVPVIIAATNAPDAQGGWVSSG